MVKLPLILYLDLETKSKIDLKKHGLMRYAQDPSTSLICASYAFDSEKVQTWFPEDGEPFPVEVLKHIKAGKPIFAHNAAFERALFDFVLSEDYDFDPPKLEQWRCSQAAAMVHGLPASLMNLGRALDLKVQKQKYGSRLIKDYSVNMLPWKPGDKALMQKYCEGDVYTMRMAMLKMRDIGPDEWAAYHQNERLNDLGVPVDVAFATAALEYVEAVKVDVNAQILELTDGAVPNAAARKSRDKWLLPKLTSEQVEILTVVKDDIEKFSLDESHRSELLACQDLGHQVRALIELINEAGGSSTAKYKSVVNTSVDGRLHGMMVWHGAGTSRYTSKGFQIHNVIRNAFSEPEPLISDVLNNFAFDNPSATLSRLLRSVVTSPDGITWSDWSAIEGRICPWLSDTVDGDTLLDIFRKDEDIYIATAKAAGLKDRQAGKIAALSMQYAGGAGALMGMAKNFGVVYTKAEAETIKKKWRRGNLWCVNFWTELLVGAKYAVSFPGKEYAVGRITFICKGDWLFAVRPSGRVQMYYQPRFEKVEYPWGGEGIELTALAGSVKPAVGEKWPRRALTSGIIIENVCQGAAADLLHDALALCAEREIPVIFSVHDEIVVEGDYVDQLQEVMDVVPDWASGLPLKAETTFKSRYGK